MAKMKPDPVAHPQPTGYKNPPREHQFKPGHPGYARKKPAPGSFLDDLRDVLAETIVYKEGGRQRKTTNSKLLFISAMRAAVAGDHHARRDIISLVAKNPKLFATRPELRPVTSDMTDKEAIETLMAAIKADKL